MIIPATLPLRGTRTTALVYTITFNGPDLTGAHPHAVVLQNWDNNPASPAFALSDGAADGVTGLRLISTATVGGVIQTTYQLTIAAADMATVPAAAVVGGDVSWVWYLDITPATGAKQRYLEGSFVVGGSGSGTGSSGGAIVTVNDQSVAVTIQGADLLAAYAASAKADADRAAAAVAAVIPSTSKLTWLDFSAGTLPSAFTMTRSQGSTDAFYDDAPGRAYNTVAANIPVFWHGGLWRGGSSKNWFLNSTAPVTQTITLPAGSYAMYGNGTGTMTSAAGTAVGSGFGALALSNRSYQIFTITTGGTVTITVAGTCNWAMVANDAGTVTKATLGPLIVTTGAAVTRNADVLNAVGGLLTMLQSGAGTFAIETSRIELGASTTDLLIQNNSAQLQYDGGLVKIWDGTSGSIPSASVGDALPLSSSRTRWGFAFSGTSASFGAGTHVPAASTQTWPSPTSATIGGTSNPLDTGALNGVIHRIGYLSTRLSDADLAAELHTPDLDTAAIKLPNWEVAKRAVLAGTADAIVLAYGTSHFAGTNPAGGVKPASWPMLWAADLAASGIPTASDSNFGNGGQTPSAGVSSYDPTVTFSSGITNWSANLGNIGLRMQSAASIDKTVARATDTFKVFAQRSVTTTGTPHINVGLTGGGSTTNFALLDNDNVQIFTITVPRLANNSFRIAWVSGDVTILGWIPSDSTTRVVQVVNGGCPLFTATNLNDANVLRVVTAIGANLTFYGAVTNDYVGLTSLSSYKTTTAANIATAQATGDVVVLTDPPSATSVASNAVQAQYNAAEMGVAFTAGVPVIDIFGEMKGLYAKWAGDGYYTNAAGSTDTIHLGAPYGYPLVANIVAGQVL